MANLGPRLKMKTVFYLVLSMGLALPSVLNDTYTTDGCYRNFAGSIMTCHGTLPSFANESFAQLSHVQQLDVLQCHFSDVPKRTFQGMLNLITLLINCNSAIEQLTFAENTLQDLGQLQLLSLNQNNIRELPPNFICHAPSLENVFLWRNLVTSVDKLGLYSHCNSSETIHRCGQAIRTLVLSKNFIESLPNHMMCTLQNLTRLDLSQNRISNVDPDAFAHLKSLLELDLSENNLTLLPEKVGKSLKKLLILNLSHNMLLDNVTLALSHLNRLERLNLTNTGAAFRNGMKDDSLRFRKNLYILDLNENAISEINETIFEPVIDWPEPGMDLDMKCQGVSIITFDSKLSDPSTSLETAENNIAHGDLPSGVTGVRYLSLDSNEFDKFPSAVKVLRKLQILSLKRNRIQALHDDDFQALSYLHLLRLSFNNIRNISGAVFRNMRCLLQLHLDHNAIQSINNTAFDSSLGLLELFLQHNKISNIGTFRHNLRLKTLDLSHNLLTTVAIESLPLSLISLNLSHNNLLFTSSSRSSYPPHLAMELLDLSHNQITRIDKNLFPLSVGELYLNDNRISSIDSCTFCAMGRLRKLHINNNLLKTARPEWFQINAKIPTLVAIVYLQGNPIVCDCRLKTFANAISKKQLAIARISDAEALQCQPEFYKGRRQSISMFSMRSPEDFLCKSNHSLNASLSEQCNIYHDLTWNLIIGDCSNANLAFVPSTIPSNVRYLYFDGNNIKKIGRATFNRTVHIQKLFLNNSRIVEIENRAFQPLAKLKILHLENNLLHVVSGDTFLGLAELTELYLFSNQLSHMEEETFEPLVTLRSLQINDNQLTTFPVWELAHLNQLTEIRLSRNPWSCECDYLQKYREWLQKSASKVQDVQTLFCNYGDNSTSAIPLIAYNGSNCYSSQTFLESKYFPLTTCLSALALFIFVASALMFTYREEIRVIVYYRYGLRLFTKDGGEQDGDQNKIYDAFVCYSHDDENFVSEQLIAGLEGIDPPFRLCVHSRDFVIGSFITDNILEAVEKSRRTILILSENFMRSEWCRFEFKTAHLQMFRDPSHRVILIVRGVIPQNLHPEMKVYLKTNTYLLCDDRLFWKRLYYAMPDRIASTG